MLAGVTAYKAHLITLHALEGHKLCSKFVAMNRFLGAVADGAGQKAVSSADTACRQRVRALHKKT
jgi:hypothetical protein